MDVFVKYKVGKNLGYGVLVFDENLSRFGRIGRCDLESIKDASFIKILSNEGTKRAAVDEGNERICVVGERRFVADYAEQKKWFLTIVEDNSEIAKCKSLMLQESMDENRNRQKGNLIDVLNDISKKIWENYPKERMRIRKTVENAMELIGALDTYRKEAKNAFGRFVHYRDGANVGFAEILGEDKDEIALRFLTNNGTRDACFTCIADMEGTVIPSPICIVGGTHTYKKSRLQKPNMDITLVEEDDDLRVCHYLSLNMHSLLDSLKRQKEEISDCNASIDTKKHGAKGLALRTKRALDAAEEVETSIRNAIEAGKLVDEDKEAERDV